MLDKKDSPGPLFYLLNMSRGSLLPGCDCWSVVQNASVVFVPAIHRVSALTPTPLLLSSLVDMLQAGLTPLCLAWSNSHLPTILQVGLLSLCFGWLIPMANGVHYISFDGELSNP